MIDAGLLLDGRYRIIARRAAGATATVWETDDEFLRRRVAVKILHDHLAADHDFRARFVDEARTAATVNHPNLVAVYDSIRDQPGIVLEWVDGPDLRQRLDQGSLTPTEVIEIGASIADGLAALHTHRLVHRDVKPANILLTVGGTPKLTDFGIATANAGDRTATGIVLGTAKYLAPEQVRGREVDGRTDLFALAAVLYESLAGTPPWSRDGDLPTALARLEEDPPDLRDTHPHLPPALSATVMRGLEREPEDRWPGMTEFAAALRNGSTLSPPPSRPTNPTANRTAAIPSSGPPTVALAPARRSPTRVRPRRRRWPRLVGAGIVIAIAALGWTLVSSVGGGTTTPPVDPARADGTDDGDLLGLAVRSVVAFDPEGTGTPGEHNDRAVLAIDRDLATGWPTERYATRDLGAKSGVGLLLTLVQVSDVETVTIHTDGADDWAVEIHVATGITAADADSIADFGAPEGLGTSLGSTAEIPVGARGDTVLVWLTDLGRGETPIMMTVAEVTIR
ncbi:MAG: serine/threonine-protein kinase [Acidimicrobiales bacterium]